MKCFGWFPFIIYINILTANQLTKKLKTNDKARQEEKERRQQSEKSISRDIVPWQIMRFSWHDGGFIEFGKTATCVWWSRINLRIKHIVGHLTFSPAQSMFQASLIKLAIRNQHSPFMWPWLMQKIRLVKSRRCSSSRSWLWFWWLCLKILRMRGVNCQVWGGSTHTKKKKQ